MGPPTVSSSVILASAQARAEAKAQLLLRLRAQGYADLPLLRALESAPRGGRGRLRADPPDPRGRGGRQDRGSWPMARAKSFARSFS
jgi:hypothetical protein